MAGYSRLQYLPRQVEGATVQLHSAVRSNFLPMELLRLKVNFLLLLSGVYDPDPLASVRSFAPSGLALNFS